MPTDKVSKNDCGHFVMHWSVTTEIPENDKNNILIVTVRI